jgi:hypothetical protein
VWDVIPPQFESRLCRFIEFLNFVVDLGGEQIVHEFGRGYGHELGNKMAARLVKIVQRLDLAATKHY